MSQKLTELTTLGSPLSTDYLYVVTDPSGTKLSRAATVQNVVSSIDKDAGGFVAKSGNQTSIAGNKTWTGQQIYTATSSAPSVFRNGTAGTQELQVYHTAGNGSFIENKNGELRLFSPGNIRVYSTSSASVIIRNAGDGLNLWSCSGSGLITCSSQSQTTNIYDDATSGGVLYLHFGTGRAILGASTKIEWRNGDSASSPQDLFLGRSAANSLYVRAESATSVGPTIQFQGYSSTTTALPMSSIVTSWATATHAARTGRTIFNAVDFNGTREAVRYEATGSAAKVGFLGAVSSDFDVYVNGTFGTSGAVGIGATPSGDQLYVYEGRLRIRRESNNEMIALVRGGVRAWTLYIDNSAGELYWSTDGSGATYEVRATAGQTSLAIFRCKDKDSNPAMEVGADGTTKFYKATYSATGTLTDGTNISWDVTAKPIANVTLAGNRTLDNPTNMVAGASFLLKVTQDGSGGHTLAYGNAYKWPGGTVPTLSTGIGDIDILTFYCDGTSMYGNIVKDFS
jgi:hypothetical protein